MCNSKRVKIGDVFTKLKARYLGRGVKAQHASKVRTDTHTLPLIYAKKGDNGVMYWGQPHEWESHENVISIIYNGAVAAGLVYAQEKCRVLAESYLIKVIDRETSHNVNLYLATALEKVLYPKYSREHLATWENKVENDYITLPIDKNGEIDYDYMENYILTLQQKRVAEMREERKNRLKAYLQATGIGSCKLSDTETKAIERCNNGEIKYKECNIGGNDGLFTIETTKKKFNANSVKFGGKYPYVVRSSKNNGVRGYITEDTQYLNEANTISFGQDTATIYYQEKPYFTGDKIKIMCFKKGILNKEIATYLITCMRRAFSNFAWGQTSFKVDILNTITISLPKTSKGEIDFDFMTNYIKAQQKLVIKEVMAWKKKLISGTKQIINS